MCFTRQMSDKINAAADSSTAADACAQNDKLSCSKKLNNTVNMKS